MSFEEWCKHFDGVKHSRLSGAETLVASAAWDAGRAALEKQLAERDAALARCVEALWSANESLWNNALNDAARKLEKVIASLPTSAQATAKVLAECRWRWTFDDEAWATGCGNLFVLNDGAPKQNGMGFCPYCGEAIREES